MPSTAPTTRPISAFAPVRSAPLITEPTLFTNSPAIAAGEGTMNGSISKIITSSCQRPTKTTPKTIGASTARTAEPGTRMRRGTVTAAAS